MTTRANPLDPPRFETLDGCPVTRRMRVNSRKPTVRLSTTEAIDRYDWDLSQDDALVESARSVTTGITHGTCIQFTPTEPLRRGPVEGVRLPDGYFFPPFGTRWSYRTSTYAGHSDFAVDFNRGGPGADEGDWVSAPAPGIVVHLDFRAPGTDGPDDPGVSDLLIDHAGGFRTLYSHMKDIAQEGAGGCAHRATAAPGSHLRHRHHDRLPSAPRPLSEGFAWWERLRQADQDAVSGCAHGRKRWGLRDGPRGRLGRAGPAGPWPGPARRVQGPRVATARSRSRWRELRFTVTTEGQQVPDCVDPGCPPATMRLGNSGSRS